MLAVLCLVCMQAQPSKRSAAATANAKKSAREGDDAAAATIGGTEQSNESTPAVEDACVQSKKKRRKMAPPQVCTRQHITHDHACQQSLQRLLLALDLCLGLRLALKSVEPLNCASQETLDLRERNHVLARHVTAAEACASQQR